MGSIISLFLDYLHAVHDILEAFTRRLNYSISNQMQGINCNTHELREHCTHITCIDMTMDNIQQSDCPQDKTNLDIGLSSRP